MMLEDRWWEPLNGKKEGGPVREEAKRRNRSTRYGQAGAEVAPVRPLSELNSITDCVEEVLFAAQFRFSLGSLIFSQAQAERVGYDLYDHVEAIILRAQELPRPEGDPDSPLQP